MAESVDDGFDVERTVAPPNSKGLDIKVKFRPATALQVMAFDRDTSMAAGDQMVKRLKRFLADHVIEWDLKDKMGKPIDPKKPEDLDRASNIWQLYAVRDAIVEEASALEIVLGN